MSISEDDVLKVARLAKLHVAAENLPALSGQLSRIVDMVEQLESVNTEGVEPLAHAMELHSVLRADAVAESLSREAALANAPQHDTEYFLVPPVM